MQQIKGHFYGDMPNAELHKYSANMTINGKSMIIEGDKQLLYRGTKLKNTEFIFGLVIYTGKNTKIMKNS
jgi:phospholipid-transporting ATPase